MDTMTRKQLLAANNAFRNAQRKDNHLWPVRNRYDLAERTIRKAGEFRASYGAMDVDEYTALLEAIASEIVNNPSNW